MKSTDSRSWNRLSFRALPHDLLVVVAFVLLAEVLVSTVAAWPILRVLVGLPVLFFLPGYVLLAVLYPGDEPEQTTAETRAIAYGGGTPTFPTRVALSFGLSVALLPLFGVLLALSPVGFGASSMIALISVHVIVGAIVGTARRMRLPPRERLHVPAGRWADALAGFVTGGRSALGTLTNVLLVATVILAASSFAYAVFAPPADAGHTDFMLLTRSDDGEFVASDYPSNFTRGDGQELVVGIANDRDQQTQYEVAVELQRIRGQGEAHEVVERSELVRLDATVGPGETWYRPHDVVPDLAGDDLRLVYYFYRGEAAANPSTESADDYLHLWIDVSMDSQGNTTESAGPEEATGTATPTPSSTSTPTPTPSDATPTPTPTSTPTPTATDSPATTTESSTPGATAETTETSTPTGSNTTTTSTESNSTTTG